MCVLELSTLKGVREGPLSDVSYDSLTSTLDFTALTQFVWVHFRMSRTIRSLANYGFLLHFNSTAMSGRVSLRVSWVVSRTRPRSVEACFPALPGLCLWKPSLRHVPFLLKLLLKKR